MAEKVNVRLHVQGGFDQTVWFKRLKVSAGSLGNPGSWVLDSTVSSAAVDSLCSVTFSSPASLVQQVNMNRYPSLRVEPTGLTAPVPSEVEGVVSLTFTPREKTEGWRFLTPQQTEMFWAKLHDFCFSQLEKNLLVLSTFLISPSAHTHAATCSGFFMFALSGFSWGILGKCKKTAKRSWRGRLRERGCTQKKKNEINENISSQKNSWNITCWW